MGNAYSETFIQAHKNLIDAEVFYYYEGLLPRKLEGCEKPLNPLHRKLFYKLVGLIVNDWSLNEKKALRKSLKSNKIQVALAEYGNTATHCIDVLKSLNIPLITHFHGYDASVRDIIAANDNYQEVFKYSSFVVVVSKVMYQKLMQLGCPEEKLVLNTYGPSPDFEALNCSCETQNILAVGRFVNKKAPNYTILAFKEVLNEFPEARLLMAGEGDLLSACKDLAKQLQIQQNVSFLGVIDHDEFRKQIITARAFIQHSITAENGDMEGTPVAILEASLAGLPVISTFHAGIPDVIIHQETGLLVDEHDVNGMAKHLREILRDKSFAKQLGEAGKRNISENFSMKKHIGTINDLIYQLANN